MDANVVTTATADTSQYIVNQKKMPNWIYIRFGFLSFS
jgi:hypothetical protein